MKRPAIILMLGVAALAACRLGAADMRGRQFFGWDDFAGWSESAAPPTHPRVLTSPTVRADLDWDEAVLSWNAETPAGTGLKLELARLEPAPASPFYVMGLWATDPAGHPRASVRGQKDEFGEVQTDTLALRTPARAVQIRVTLTGDTAGVRPKLKFIGLSLADTKASPEPAPPHRAAWGRDLPVPERTQVLYPEGVTAWCSPTSLAMILAFWGERLGRPELILEVPEVAKAVHDPQWPGTGNWVFNTAFAGSFPGLRASVTRLSDIAELEQCVAAGMPVAVSVSYNLLRGLPRDRDDGHIVVVRGFTSDGNPGVNDPGTGKEIRRVFRRDNLARAWAVSHNTVYLVHPVNWPLPDCAKPKRPPSRPGA